MILPRIMESIYQVFIMPENEQKHICLIIGACIIFLAGCGSLIPTDEIKYYHSLIPIPRHISFGNDFFFLTSDSGIRVPETAQKIGTYLSETMCQSTGYHFDVMVDGETNEDITLVLDPGLAVLGEEGYKCLVDKNGVTITAVQPAGLFYGCQTLLQLLPPKIFSPEYAGNVQWKIPFVHITDMPRYSWRGAMLDVARHFFSVREVKRFIDLMAMHKLNRFHLHLTDDQGWRIQIKSWPFLALHGGSSEVDGGPGGYYTQEEYADIVRYAHDRYITLIPEIDMPGHTNAALACYAELNCSGKATELYHGTGGGFSCLDIHNETVYTFIQDVIIELSALTKGPYIHIGGDEVEKVKTPDYIYFINRVQTIVNSCKKQVIGWEEINDAGLCSSTIVQYWKELHNAQRAVEKGNNIIVSPASKLYLDMKYNVASPVGQDWAGIINVKDAYDWDPGGIKLPKKNILGIEAVLWTETASTMKDVEYLAFPRLAGYAELGWSDRKYINWEDYKARLSAHGPRLNALGVHYYRSPHIIWEK